MTRLSPRHWLARIGRKNLLFAAVSGGTVLFAATLMATAPNPEPPQVEEKAWPVSTISATPARLAPELDLFGRTESPHHAELRSAITADVLTVHVREGEWVKKDQLLLSLDNRDEQLSLQRAAATLRDAEAQLNIVKTNHLSDKRVLAHMQELYNLTSAKADRLKSLIDRHLIATEQLENTLQEVARQGIELAQQQAVVDNYAQRKTSAEAAIANARAALDNQHLNLTRTRILAPFEGRVSALPVSPGDRVSSGASLISLYDTGALQIRAALPSQQLDQLKQALARGEPITAQVIGTDTRVELSELAAAVDSGRAGVDGLFRLPAGGAGLELGRAVRLRLTLPAVDQLIALPLLSVYNHNRIFVVDKQRLRGIEVSVRGQRSTPDGGLQVLVSAPSLSTTTQVLASSLPQATSGLLVTDVSDTASAPAG